jgi:hypothetical protein
MMIHPVYHEEHHIREWMELEKMYGKIKDASEESA